MSTVQSATDIRGFHIDIPDAKLADLNRRVSATRWPSREFFASELRAAFEPLR